MANPEANFGYFKEGLQKLGCQDGRNTRIEFRNAEGEEERLADLAAGYVDRILKGARTVGIRIPQSLLLRADQVIVSAHEAGPLRTERGL